MNRHGFPYVFQMFNLNKDITGIATSRAIFARHAMDHRENEREDSDPHALRRNSAKDHPLRPPFSAIGLSNPLSMCIIPEKEGSKKKPRR